jgi:iron(III) transport system substrate-binding protein
MPPYFMGILLFGIVSLWSVISFAAAAAKDPNWEQIVAAAKREGKVAILGPVGTDVRDAFTQGFQKKYPEIQVDYFGTQGPQVAPRLFAELNAGRYLTDLVVSGTTTALESLVPANAIIPIQPFLVGPETQELSKWRDGKLHFSDEAEKYNLVYGMRVQVAFVYNRDKVSPAKIKSWKDLLNPEWKGQMVMENPRRAGGGLDLATFWYTQEKLGLGKSFIRQFFTTQEILLSNDDRQALDFVARGRHLLAVGSSGVLSFEFKSKGLPIELLSSSALQEGGFVTASNGTVSVVRNAPRLNAVKLYLDYLLSSEAQLAWSKASGLSSLRRDVSRDHIPELLVPKENITYQENHTEKYVLMRKEIVDFINSVLPR